MDRKSSTKVILPFVTSGGGPIAGYHWWCPGCEMHHLFCTREYRPNGNPVWKFDGNEEAPTVEPSIRTTIADSPRKDCHVFLRAGKIEYLGDSYHKLAGQTVPMLPAKDWPY